MPQEGVETLDEIQQKSILLISLAMLDVEYFRWVKKSSLFFLFTFLVVVGFICLGIAVGY